MFSNAHSRYMISARHWAEGDFTPSPIRRLIFPCIFRLELRLYFQEGFVLGFWDHEEYVCCHQAAYDQEYKEAVLLQAILWERKGAIQQAGKPHLTRFRKYIGH